MADKQKAITFVLALEDDKQHPGCITQLRGDSGGRTRLGIAERFHPDLSKHGFFDGDPIEGSTNPLRWKPTTIADADGHKLAVDTYTKEYADPLTLDQIASQDVANRFLGFAVNEGIHQAIVILQRCLPGTLADGCLGPQTIAAVNACDPSDLIGRMKVEQSGFYTRLAEVNPSLAQYANGLQHRALA